VDLGDAKRGHEQKGRRFGIILSSTSDAASTVVIVPTSTRAQPSIYRPQLEIAGRDTLALTDQIRTIDKRFVVDEPVDHLTGADMAQVEYALGRLLALRIELDY
jgi:mRNA interferase MazF